MRAQFIASETRIGLRRNVTLTLAVIVSVAVSLAFVGGGLLAQKQVGKSKDFWYDKVEVSVFLCGSTSVKKSCPNGSVTDAQRAALNAKLADNPLVAKVFYESKADAFKHFKEQFKDSAITQNTSEGQLPESFRVKLKDPQRYRELAQVVDHDPGVEAVSDQRKVLEPFFSLLNLASVGAWILAVLMLISALLLVGTTIRVAAFSRRRETGIMRLVGASNFYIRLPFVLEAVLAGLLGALISCGLLAAFIQFFVGAVSRRFAFTTYIDWADYVATVPWVLLAGVLLPAVAAMLTLRRHLRV